MPGTENASNAAEPVPDVEDELDRLGEKEVETVKKETTTKKGTLVSPPPVAGVKRSRDEIMAELKAQRKAAAEAKAASASDNRFRKVGEKQKSRIQIDHKGREVLVTVDEDGIVKKKVRKIPTQEKAELDMPDASRPVLGADAVVPAVSQLREPEVEEDSDHDIFEGEGTEYNPLGDDDEDDDSEDSNDDSDVENRSEKTKTTEMPSKGFDAAENTN